MYIRLFSAVFALAAVLGQAADPPPAKAKGGVEEWSALNTQYQAINRQLMSRRNAIVRDSEEGKVIQAQIRDLTEKIQELKQGLAEIVAEDEEYKRLQAAMQETRSKLQAVQISRRATTRRPPGLVSPINPSATPAPGPPPPPPPPPPVPR
ncbi:MAG: septal ring factor EnvC (AmiA/AmiB activator) [Rhodothermales bacterium]|jgi:septal ring factor EnvC (AmiA/AmiB activator)